MVHSPHKVGEEALAEWIPWSEEKRSGPWVKWLLLLVVVAPPLMGGVQASTWHPPF